MCGETLVTGTCVGGAGPAVFVCGVAPLGPSVCLRDCLNASLWVVLHVNKCCSLHYWTYVPSGLCKTLIRGNMENRLQDVSHTEAAGITFSFPADLKEDTLQMQTLPVLLHNVQI